MAWEEDSCICLNMQLIAILSRIGVSFSYRTLLQGCFPTDECHRNRHMHSFPVDYTLCFSIKHFPTVVDGSSHSLSALADTLRMPDDGFPKYSKRLAGKSLLHIPVLRYGSPVLEHRYENPLFVPYQNRLYAAIRLGIRKAFILCDLLHNQTKQNRPDKDRREILFPVRL